MSPLTPFTEIALLLVMAAGYRGRVAVTSHGAKETTDLLSSGADLVLEPFQDAAGHGGADPLDQPDHQRHLGIALAFEPSEAGTMARPPRPRNAPLLSGTLVWHVVMVALLFLVATFGIFSYAIDRGYPLALAQTIAMNMVVVLEIFHLFFIRNIHSTSLTWKAVRGTKVVWVVIAIITAAQFAVTYLAPLQTLLGTMAVPLTDGLLIIAIGVCFFAVIEIEKQIRLGLRR